MKKINLTEGAIATNLIRFSIPMIIGNLLQQVYNLVDTLIVGRFLGADALAAVGSVFTLMGFILSIIVGLCMGSGAYFSADFGAGDEKKLKEDLRLSFFFIGSVSVFLGIIVYPGMDTILRMLQTPQSLMDLTKEYVVVLFAGIMFMFLYNFFAYLLRSVGDSFTPLKFLAVSSVTNIVLDICFVIIFHWGVGGAAFATVISQAISGVGIAIYALKKFPFLKRDSEKFVLNIGRLKAIMANGIMTSMQQSVMNLGILMIQGLINSFGASIMASYAAAVKIDTVAFTPPQEFGNAYSFFVSQNCGAGNDERIRKGTKSAFLISVVFCIGVSAVTFIFAENLMGIFIDPSETQIIADGVKYLRIEGAMYIGLGMLFLWYAYFRGIGKSHIALILTIISLGTRVAISYAFAKTSPLGVNIIWMSIPIGWFLADTAGYLFYRKEKPLDAKRF